MEKVIKRVLLVALKAGGFCFLWLLVGPCPSSHTSFCTECGIRAGISEVRFGLTPLRVGQEFDFHTNAVSAALLQDQRLAGHEHVWLFAYGGPPGVSVIGSGRHLTIPLRDTNAAAFVSHLVATDDKASVDTWRRRLLDPEHTEAARSAMLLGREDRRPGESWIEAAERMFADFSDTPKSR